LQFKIDDDGMKTALVALWFDAVVNNILKCSRWRWH